MSKFTKLALDILIGAVAPVLILKYGTARIGTLPAYLTAALVPVAWVMLDLFVITRRFNFITSYSGFGAVMRGALAFWYVDGALFAFKDSASYLLALIVFGGTLFIGKPVTRAIALQGLAPDTPERTAALERLFDEPTVTRALRRSTVIVALTNLACGCVNYWINWRIVVAPFNTAAFNNQVANVNAITRVVLVLPDMLALFWAFSLMYKAMYALLPDEAGNRAPAGDLVQGPGASMTTVARGKEITREEPDFWDLVDRRESMLAAGAKEPSFGDSAAVALANQQARGAFGLVK